MKNFDLNLSEFEIDKYRYRELKNFCLQYPAWAAELKYNTDTLKSPAITGMPSGGEVESQTEKLAIRRAELQRKCDLIESAAIEADQDIHQYIMKNTTQEGMGYWRMREWMGLTAGEGRFYRARRRFFTILNKKRI